MVEDEDKVSRFVSRGMISERFAVDVAGDGKSGLEFAQIYQYDLVIDEGLIRPRISTN